MHAFAALVVAVLLLVAAPARAEWREASSPQFIIYADANESWLRRFADKLERFDGALRLLQKIPDRRQEIASNRLVIYIVPGGDRATALCGKGCGSVAGFYLPRAGNAVAFSARNDSGGEWDISSDVVLFHEYTHHLAASHFTRPYPRWFGEGFAEFYSTARVDRDGSVGIGYAAQHRAYGLIEGTTIPIERLIDPPRRAHAEFWDAFYGRSWMLTSMLMSSTERANQLNRYLALIAEGKPNLTAAREAFGDLKALDRDITAALRKPLKGLRVKADAIAVGATTLRVLTPGEAAMMPVRLRSDRGVDRAQALALVPDARRRATPHLNDARVQAMLAEVEYDAGNDAEAEAAADRALAADPGNLDAMLYKGRVLLRRATAKASDAAMLKAARVWFVRANRRDPNAAEPLMLNFGSYAWAGIRPTPNAVEGLLRAVELSPHAQELRFMAGVQMLNDDRPKEARALLLPLAFDPHGRGSANVAQQMVEGIDKGEKASDILRGLPIVTLPAADGGGIDVPPKTVS
jgi:tetratricopeptide (TPR) repeat protein